MKDWPSLTGHAQHFARGKASRYFTGCPDMGVEPEWRIEADVAVFIDGASTYCGQGGRSPMVFIVFNLGILWDYNP